MRSFYGLIKQGEESVRAMGRGEGQYRYFRQVCLPKCSNRRGCLSMTVYEGRDAVPQLSQEGFPWSGSQDMYATASVLLRRGCSGQGPLRWCSTKSVARADATQLLPCQ